MWPTMNSLITISNIGTSFYMGPRDQHWMIVDVNEEEKQALCNLVGTKESVWLSCNIVYDMIEAHKELMDRLYECGGCC
jgi:hypothetical protein